MFAVIRVLSRGSFAGSRPQIKLSLRLLRSGYSSSLSRGLYSHRNNFVGDVIFVKLLHVQQHLVGVGEEGFLRRAEPVVHLQTQSARAKRA